MKKSSKDDSSRELVEQFRQTSSYNRRRLINSLFALDGALHAILMETEPMYRTKMVIDEQIRDAEQQLASLEDKKRHKKSQKSTANQDNS